MEKVSCKRLLVLFLLLGLVAAAFAYGEDKVEEVSTAAKEKAAEAQGAAESVTGWGKEKLDTVPKQSAESIERAKETASDTASGVTDSGKEKLGDVSSKLQEGSEHAKSTGDEVVGKTHETVQATSDKASEAAGVASGKTKESAHVAGEKSQGAYESTKQILEEQYEAAKGVVNEHLKAASKLASDVGEHVKHLTGAGHEEL
ncbi:unnamed protein product [Sphagnum troendelagicum]|uniref:Uncharacterized protein n=1 Tax=Sphagnum troendelagicum TaxID=128251 RepID=A0ABP0U9S9_9BRYO